VPTPETYPVAPSSLNSQAKYDTEVKCCEVGSHAGIPTTILRFSCVFGTRQPTLKAHPGVVTQLARQILNGTSPQIFEDGKQQRDLVSVYDVTEALALALESDAAAGEVFNIASGTSYSLLTLAERLAAALGHVVEPEITGTYRTGDVRHSLADITKAQTILGFRPEVSLDAGLAELAEWMRDDAAAAGLKNDAGPGVATVAAVPVPAV
jgi:dTDP-L-rhamnose 4-epimerase